MTEADKEAFEKWRKQKAEKANGNRITWSKQEKEDILHKVAELWSFHLDAIEESQRFEEQATQLIEDDDDDVHITSFRQPRSLASSSINKTF